MRTASTPAVCRPTLAQALPALIVAAAVGLSGCATQTSQAADAKPATPKITSLSTTDQGNCRKIFASAPTGTKSLMLVVDNTASTPELPIPTEVATDIAAASRRGDALTVIAVNGVGVKPTVLLNRVGTSSKGPRDAPSVERIAQKLPSCVNWMVSEQKPTGRGTDFYPAAALADEIAGANTTMWWLTDAQFNAGIINLSAKGWLGKPAAQAAQAMAKLAPLDLSGATIKVAGIGNTTVPIAPQGRVWLTNFVRTLCVQWNGAGCTQISRAPQTALTERPASWPSDPGLTFPGADPGGPHESTEPGCLYALYGSDLFVGDATTLRSDPRGLKDVVDAMNARPKGTVVIIGNLKAGTAGEAELQANSLKRAKAVVEALVAQGINRSRLTASGVGGSDPATDAEPRYRDEGDRRVVFRTTGIPCSAFPQD